MQQERDFEPKAIIYVAPPFRHSHFEGKQVVVHNQQNSVHEVFSYNLYPGPSAKKGVYGVLLALGLKEDFVTVHASTVNITTPYEMISVYFMKEHQAAARAKCWNMLTVKKMDVSY